MRKLILVLSLTLTVTVNVSAARLGAERGRPLEPVASERLAKVLREAFAVFSLPDGSRWFTHRVPARMEPAAAIGVTRFAVDGSVRVFLLSDWLPKGALPGGRAGQIYGVAQLDDGRIAVSGGWNDGESHNAILVLRPRNDGGYDTDAMFEWRGLHRIAGGSRNTILAVTHDLALRGGGPLVTLFDAEGRRLGSGFHQNDSRPAVEAISNGNHARLLRLSEHRFALYDGDSETIFVWDLDREGARGSVWTPVTNIFVGDDASTAGSPVIEIAAAGPEEILVARTGQIGGSYKTQLSIYGFDPGVKDVALTEHPWRFILRENGLLRGVVMRGNPHYETVGPGTAD